MKIYALLKQHSLTFASLCALSAAGGSLLFVSPLRGAAQETLPAGGNPSPTTNTQDNDKDNKQDSTQHSKEESHETKADADEKKADAEDTPKKGNVPKSARWQVSWGVDPDTLKMSATPTPINIARLVTFKRPKDLPGKGTAPEIYRTHRIARIETTLWSVKGTVVSVAAEHDGDYRLIVADAAGHQVCCVLPDPALAPKTGRFSAQINAARAVVVKRFHPTFTARDVHVPVQVVGPGYFGRMNPEENPSPEGFQLHPVVGVQFPDK